MASRLRAVFVASGLRGEALQREKRERNERRDSAARRDQLNRLRAARRRTSGLASVEHRRRQRTDRRWIANRAEAVAALSSTARASSASRT